MLSSGLLLLFGIQMMLPAAPAPAPVSGVAPRNLRLPAALAPASTAFTLKTPLFSPSRTFDTDASASDSIETGIALLGVSRVRGYKRFFFKLSNGEVISASVGSNIKGWQFNVFDADRAYLTQGGRTITLQIGVAETALLSNTNKKDAAEEVVQ